MSSAAELHPPPIKALRKRSCTEIVLHSVKFHVCLVLILCAVIGLLIPGLIPWKPQEIHACFRVNYNERFDCLDDILPKERNKNLCDKRGCLWCNQSSQCFYDPENLQFPYRITSRNSSAYNLIYKLSYSWPVSNDTFTTDIVSDLTAEILHISSSHLKIVIREEEPDFEASDYLDYDHNLESDDQGQQYEVEKLSEGNNFTIRIHRLREGYRKTLLFDTGVSPFLFRKNLIELSTRLPSEYMYGLSKPNSTRFKHDFRTPRKWILQNSQTDDLSIGSSSHPFYLLLEGDGNAHGVLLVNTQPMQISTNRVPAVTFRLSGGSVEFHFFLGPSPLEVIEQLTNFIGKPAMPPYWALGYHYCYRDDNYEIDSYKLLDDVIDIGVAIESNCRIASPFEPFDLNIRQPIPTEPTTTTGPDVIGFNTPDFNIATEVSDFNATDFNITTDVSDYNDTDFNITDVSDYNATDFNITDVSGYNATDFNITDVNVTDVPDEEEREERIYPDKHILFVNPQLKLSRSDSHDNNLKNAPGLFFTKLRNGHSAVEPFTGELYETKPVVYPDFRHSKTIEWLKEEFTEFRNNTNFTDLGLFLASNTPVNTGEACKSSHAAFLDSKDIKSICPDAVDLTKGTPRYKIHNIYGYHHAHAVQEVLGSVEGFESKRQFIMSYSTFIGSGKFGGHWSGRIPPTWSMLKNSIVRMLEYNMYGIPLVATPSCGTETMNIKKQEEREFVQDLCSRWLQLSAFQPIMLTYKDSEEVENSEAKHLDPFSLGGITLQAAKSMVPLRYRLLPYLYTLFKQSHEQGLPVIRPLFMEFPNDKNTYDVDEQFLWGSALMMSIPIAQESRKRSKRVYFPHNSLWYEFNTGKLTAASSPLRNYGKYVNVAALESQLNFYIRGGHIVATQNTTIGSGNTAAMKQAGLSLTIALNAMGSAEGELYLDDGISETDPCSLRVKFSMTGAPHFVFETTSELEEKCVNENSLTFSTIVTMIKIYGLLQRPNRIIANGLTILEDYDYSDEYIRLQLTNMGELDLRHATNTIHLEY